MHAYDRRQDYLVRLRNELDASTFTATLCVLLQETRAGIGRQRSLIALERLARRNTTVRMSQLRELEEMRAALTTALLRAGEGAAAADIDDIGTGTVIRLSVGGG